MKRTSRNNLFPAACAIVTRSYLSDARVLAASYLEHHPGARFYLLVVDPPDTGIDAGAGVQVIDCAELNLEYLRELSFKYSPTEFCCALKPTFVNLLLRKYKEERVIYLDSDILVLKRMDELLDAFAQADIVLTPHLNEPIPDDGMRPNEQDILVAGAHNLGFIAVRRSKTTYRFLAWWEQRLRDGGFIEFSEGLLTDQRWIDLAPSLFSTIALKDATYNVAYWNIHSRRIEIDRKNGGFLVKGRGPLTFFHFSGFDPARPDVFSKHQTRTQIETGSALAALIVRYSDLQMRNGFAACRSWKYGFGAFDNGTPIGAPMRHAYSKLDQNQRAFYGDPFRTGEGSFFEWATQPDEFSRGMTPFLTSLYEMRTDLVDAFPDIHGRDRTAFLDWASTDGAVECNYDPGAMRVKLGPEMLVEIERPRGPKCAVIIPVFNNASLTRACLDTVLAETRAGFDFETIVSDDGSTDATASLLENYPRVRVVSSAANLGFSTACNNAAAITNAEYLVFLNNDTEPQEGWLDALVRYADAHPEAAAVGSKLLFPNGTIQHAGFVICEDRQPRHIYAGFPSDDPRVNRSRAYQAVTGACLLIRRTDFTAMGGFDAAYRNGFEDVDLCLRLGEYGREIHYCHESVLIHLESASRDSSQKTPDGQRNANLYRERWAGRVRPDEFTYYFQDEVLKIDYRPVYPLAFAVSPLLATVNGADPEHLAERLIQARSNQVIGLLKDNIRLTIGAREAEFRLQGHKGGTNTNGRADVPAAVRAALPNPQILAKGQSLWLSDRPTNRLVSIILPVKNGEAKLQKLLPALLSQKSRDLVEIVAIDSASSDGSVDLLRQANATVIGIDPRAFNHGLTRNLATKYAHGSFFVFINQSTLPADEQWLAELLRPFDSNASLAGVCGRMLPRPDADWLNAKDIAHNVNASTERVVTKITDRDAYAALGPENLRLFVNFHSLSAAIRADVFNRIPFREANFAEDLIWGKEALEAGYTIQYEPLAVALHSHNYSVLDILRRNFDDGAACNRICGRVMNERDIAPSIAHEVRDDWRHLKEDCRLEGTELDEWKLRSVMRRSAQQFGHWMGVQYEMAKKDPAGLASILSITEQIKAGAKTEQPEAWIAHAHSAG